MTGDTLLGDEVRGQSQCIHKTSKAAPRIKENRNRTGQARRALQGLYRILWIANVLHFRFVCARLAYSAHGFCLCRVWASFRARHCRVGVVRVAFAICLYSLPRREVYRAFVQVLAQPLPGRIDYQHRPLCLHWERPQTQKISRQNPQHCKQGS